MRINNNVFFIKLVYKLLYNAEIVVLLFLN